MHSDIKEYAMHSYYVTCAAGILIFNLKVNKYAMGKIRTHGTFLCISLNDNLKLLYVTLVNVSFH